MKFFQEGMVDVKLFHCRDGNCGSVLSDSTGVVYLPPHGGKPVLFEDIVEVQDLVKKVLEQLPEPKDINDEEFDVNKLQCFFPNLNF